MPAHRTFSDLYKELTPGSVFVVYFALTFILFLIKVFFKCKRGNLDQVEENLFRGNASDEPLARNSEEDVFN